MAKTPQLMTFCGSLVSSCSCPRAPLPVISSPMQAQKNPVTANTKALVQRPEPQAASDTILTSNQ